MRGFWAWSAPRSFTAEKGATGAVGAAAVKAAPALRWDDRQFKTKEIFFTNLQRDMASIVFRSSCASHPPLRRRRRRLQ